MVLMTKRKMDFLKFSLWKFIFAQQSEIQKDYELFIQKHLNYHLQLTTLKSLLLSKNVVVKCTWVKNNGIWHWMSCLNHLKTTKKSETVWKQKHCWSTQFLDQSLAIQQSTMLTQEKHKCTKMIQKLLRSLRFEKPMRKMNLMLCFKFWIRLKKIISFQRSLMISYETCDWKPCR